MKHRQATNKWFSKQALLGMTLIVGGSVVLFGLAQNNQDVALATTNTPETTADKPNTATPLTADIQTEERILEQKQKEREARVATLEKEAAALIAAQQEARNQALKKAADEAESHMIPTNPSVQTRPEVIAEQKRQEQAKQEQAKQEQAKQEQAKLREQQKAQSQKTEQQKPNQQKDADEQKAQQNKPTNQKGTHTVQAGDTLIGLSKAYGVPVSIIAAANDMGRHDALQRGRTLKIPSQSEIRAIERRVAQEAAQKAAEQAERERNAALDAKLRAARQEAQKQGANGKFGVQVALASSEENADALVAALKSAGYRVSTSQTNRGIRVVVGPERSREAAQALRSKMANDRRIKAQGAWVTELP